MSDFRTMPKVELHLHLEGAAPPEFIRQLASEQKVNLSGIFDGNGSYKWTDFAEFLKVYEAASSVLRGPEEFFRLMKAVLTAQAEQGVVYTEHFLAPDLCGDGSIIAWAEHLAAMDEGAAEMERDAGITTRFIPTCIRHLGPEKARKAAEIIVKTGGARVTGFGMGGEERHLMPADFAIPFQIAAEAGLSLTCHAGEICGADMAAATLDALDVKRIGHGVRAIEDMRVVERLARDEIVLEVNPGSNISLAVFPSWHEHPIEKLRAEGVKVTVSTDDPPYFHTSLNDEYENLSHHLGWDEETLKAQNLVAIDAAFCDEATKERIKEALQ